MSQIRGGAVAGSTLGGAPAHVQEVHASGNFGDAPIEMAPACGIKLPVSTAGGFGTTTVTNAPTQLTGDVTTSGTKSPLTARVVGLQTFPISATPPDTGGVLLYHGSTWGSSVTCTARRFSAGRIIKMLQDLIEREALPTVLQEIHYVVPVAKLSGHSRKYNVPETSVTISGTRCLAA